MKKKTSEDPTNAALLLGASVVVIAAAVSFIDTVRSERKKRAAIAQWETEELAALQDAKKQVLELIDGGKYDDRTYGSAWDAALADLEFYRIVHFIEE